MGKLEKIVTGIILTSIASTIISTAGVFYDGAKMRKSQDYKVCNTYLNRMNNFLVCSVLSSVTTIGSALIYDAINIGKRRKRLYGIKC